VIAYYLLREWGFEHHVAIERPLPEYANADITHNVEYTLHPAQPISSFTHPVTRLPLTANAIARKPVIGGAIERSWVRARNQLISRDGILRNACTVYDAPPPRAHFVNAYVGSVADGVANCQLMRLTPQPFALIECKRVGVEEGNRKGPQTIEKAKQGAYVARTVSSLQRIRLRNGEIGGVLEAPDGAVRFGSYYRLLDEVLATSEVAPLQHFMLTIGVVSNHGNWFTSNNHNKELKVLAQSYDWLLFLSDAGIAQFAQDLLLSPPSGCDAARTAFLNSYTGNRTGNRFTKVQMDMKADAILRAYYHRNCKSIEGWFEVIQPGGTPLAKLIRQLDALRRKPWEVIHQ
jgi:hypothetical protein